MKKLLWLILAIFVWIITVLLCAGMHLMLIIGGNNKLFKFLDKLTSMLAIDALALVTDTCPIELQEVRQYLSESLKGLIDSFNSQY